MYTRPTAPLPIGGVVDDAIQVYRASFRACWPIAGVGSLVLGAFGIYLLIYMRKLGLGTSGLAVLQAYRQAPIAALYLLQLVLTLTLYGALIASQNAAAGGGGPIAFTEAIGIGLTRLGRAVLAAIVSWVLFMLALALLLIPGYFAVLLRQGGYGALWWLIDIIGFIVLLAPAIYVLGALCLWPVALYADNANAMQSLQSSRDLIKGHWWRSLTILSIAMIMMIVFSVVIGVVAATFAAFWRRDIVLAQIAIQCVSVIANVFVLPMIPAVLLVIYRDLKLRREGGDLAARVGALP